MNMDNNNDIPFPTDVFGQAYNAAYPVAQFQKELMEVKGASPIASRSGVPSAFTSEEPL